MQIQPYLFFPGNCEEAVDFYRRALGAEVRMMMRYSESPEPDTENRVPPESMDKIMHVAFTLGDAVVMASDMPSPKPVSFSGFALSLTPADAAAADRLFAALAQGGTVQMPLGETFWSPRFGMVTDRFGVQWMVGLAGEEA
jgi:PhnB protein